MDFRSLDVQKDLENRFNYHAPKPGQPELYAKMRGLCLELAKEIVAGTPKTREQSLALTKLEEVMFWTNAAIARHG